MSSGVAVVVGRVGRLVACGASTDSLPPARTGGGGGEFVTPDFDGAGACRIPAFSAAPLTADAAAVAGGAGALADGRFGGGGGGGTAREPDPAGAGAVAAPEAVAPVAADPAALALTGLPPAGSAAGFPLPATVSAPLIPEPVSEKKSRQIGSTLSGSARNCWYFSSTNQSLGPNSGTVADDTVVLRLF
jgi:hypothetical protein